MRVTLWSQDYAEVLYDHTGDYDGAQAYFIDSGEDWLPIVIDYGTDLRKRWSGRIKRMADGSVAVNRDFDYLRDVMQWPTVSYS